MASRATAVRPVARKSAATSDHRFSNVTAAELETSPNAESIERKIEVEITDVETGRLTFTVKNDFDLPVQGAAFSTRVYMLNYTAFFNLLGRRNQASDRR